MGRYNFYGLSELTAKFKMTYCHILFLLTCWMSLTVGQHHPPGVNPQIYQQQHVQYAPGVNPQMYQQQPQYQQQPPQYQQQPPQYQQQPQQNVQHQQPQHPQQPQQAAGPGHHNHQGQVLNSQKMAQERDHIGEHVGVPVDTSKMSEQELQFHYFKMHDADNNNKLDGCELVKSLIHWHDESNHDPKGGAPIPDPKIFTDEELRTMIDPILEQDDKNKDGFIDYPEFIPAL